MQQPSQMSQELINGTLLTWSHGPRHFENAAGWGGGKQGCPLCRNKEKPNIVSLVPFCINATVLHLISGQQLSQASNILAVSLSYGSLLIKQSPAPLLLMYYLQANKKTQLQWDW